MDITGPNKIVGIPFTGYLVCVYKVEVDTVPGGTGIRIVTRGRQGVDPLEFGRPKPTSRVDREIYITVWTRSLERFLKPSLSNETERVHPLGEKIENDILSLTPRLG